AVVSPTLVVVDYADAHTGAAIRVLQAVRRRRDEHPAVVLLTARSLDGDWLERVTTALRDDGHLTATRTIILPDQHPHGGTVFRRAFTALGGDQSRPPDPATLPQPAAGRWTTLDFVLLGWFAAQRGGELPHSQDDLYDQVLTHEQRYWAKAWRRIQPAEEPPVELIRTAAAYLTPLPPQRAAPAAALGVPADQAGPDRRHDIGRTLSTCLRPRAGERLAIHPDPVGEHLLLRQLHDDPSLLDTA